MDEQQYIRVDELVKRLRERAEAFDYDGWVETASDYEKAADVIEEQSKPKWIPVSERLPEPCVDVLALYDGGRMDIDWVDHEGRFGYESICGKVTHWMPLPDPPKPQECGDDFCPI